MKDENRKNNDAVVDRQRWNALGPEESKNKICDPCPARRYMDECDARF